jgi:hypothetical protein
VKVVMLGQMTGTRNDQKWPPVGEEIDLPDREAEKLVNQSMAELPGRAKQPGRRVIPRVFGAATLGPEDF